MNYEQMFEYLGMYDVKVDLVTCFVCGLKYKYARYENDEKKLIRICRKCRKIEV